MPVELLPAVTVAGRVAQSFKQKVDRCRARYQEELREFDCCRHCDTEHCIPCRFDPAVQAVEERYRLCKLKAWHSTLRKVLAEPTIEAIVSTLSELGGC